MTKPGLGRDHPDVRVLPGGLENGKTVGYDVVSGVAPTNDSNLRIQIAASVRGGIVYGSRRTAIARHCRNDPGRQPNGVVREA